jgi:hypothetical protein
MSIKKGRKMERHRHLKRLEDCFERFRKYEPEIFFIVIACMGAAWFYSAYEAGLGHLPIDPTPLSLFQCQILGYAMGIASLLFAIGFEYFVHKIDYF